MTPTVLLVAALLVAFGACAVQLHKAHGYLTYPLLVGVFYLAWMAPQLLSVMADPLVPAGGLWSLCLMVLLSLLAVLAGWSLGCKQAMHGLNRGGRAIPPRPSDQALVWPAAALTAVAIGARVMLAGMRLDPELTSQWSGPIVIVVTIAGIRIIPLFLSLVLVLRRRTPLTIALAATNLALSGSFAFIDIGRSETIDLALVSFLALWFARRIRIGLPLLAAGGVAVGIFVFTVGEFRSAAADNYEMTGERVSIFNPVIWKSIDFEEASARAAEGAPDVRNAVYLMNYRQADGGYTFGARFWDDLVFRWVPAQIVGRQTKAALMFEKDQQAVYETIRNQYNYQRIGGTTSTGFGIAYSEFWFFGALLFGVYAWFAGRWWTLGSHGDLWAQVMYAATLGSGLVAFTHNVYWAWLIMPLLLAGLAFVKLWIWAVSPHSPGARRRRHADPLIPGHSLQGARLR